MDHHVEDLVDDLAEQVVLLLVLVLVLVLLKEVLELDEDLLQLVVDLEEPQLSHLVLDLLVDVVDLGEALLYHVVDLVDLKLLGGVALGLGNASLMNLSCLVSLTGNFCEDLLWD